MMEWNLQARARACQACGKPFGEKEVYHTLLFDQKQDYERLDVCRACWSSQFSEGATHRKGFVSYWKGVYTHPPAAPPEPIQKASAESLLRKLVESSDPALAPARYILAAMLERKRVLKVKAEIREAGSRVFVYEHTQTGDIFQIPDPELQWHEWDRVRQDIARLLDQGAPSSAPGGDSEPTASEQSEPPSDDAVPTRPDAPRTESDGVEERVQR